MGAAASAYSNVPQPGSARSSPQTSPRQAPGVPDLVPEYAEHGTVPREAPAGGERRSSLSGRRAPAPGGASPARAPSAAPPPPLVVRGGTHMASPATAKLARDIGGVPALQAMIELFYSRMFADPHLDQFVRDHNDPHAVRLATWIVEKMGDGQPWSQERRRRSTCPVQVGGGYEVVVHDRSSAHVAAWNSPKRSPADMGQHFKLDDCRVWMRLMFWSARDKGLLTHPQFGEWFVRFIGHFVRVYERSAPPFTRDSARWSADPANVQRYISSGRRMTDVLGLSYRRALEQLPPAEREDPSWPYQ
eukprot:TRINITY_DN21154_c0_g1_i1.p1 TRINITY_DN21154_c0_g1~~TRINITY_DN21154_c0_g1_i1.p1  ORF type:complete len:329 (+),score=106.53 TRINITY_DN21154_c0_g1_i1:77-988(+)